MLLLKSMRFSRQQINTNKYLMFTWTLLPSTPSEDEVKCHNIGLSIIHAHRWNPVYCKVIILYRSNCAFATKKNMKRPKLLHSSHHLSVISSCVLLYFIHMMMMMMMLVFAISNAIQAENNTGITISCILLTGVCRWLSFRKSSHLYAWSTRVWRVG